MTDWYARIGAMTASRRQYPIPATTEPATLDSGFATKETLVDGRGRT
jgi:hypothetical protein